ncbi:hypothetical protein [Bradyrhizobium acaciae]|uniref:hypothetical protein n=1 Tax=Bradyrhizobium acaciae TaxID=2683706 RepID=UPI001E587F03|nr:hypothetical protein [Bradyrhizobium acaciae]MCC8977391.1 hypothetical protein [Bradyrhizobium acaciae]
MYYEAISQCTQSLKLVEGWLNKTVAFAEAENVDVDPLTPIISGDWSGNKCTPVHAKPAKIAHACTAFDLAVHT